MPQNRTKKLKTAKHSTLKPKAKTGAKMGFWGRIKSVVVSSREAKKR